MATPAQPMPRPHPIQPVPPPLNSPEGIALAEERAAAEAAARRQLPAWRRGFRSAVPWLFLVFLGGVVMLIALAGAGFMGDAEYWATGSSKFIDTHRNFVHIVEFVPLLIVLAGFLGADKQAGWSGVALFVLIGVQYGLVEATGIVRSFHVLNALIIFTLALLMTLSRIPWRPKSIDAPPA